MKIRLLNTPEDFSQKFCSCMEGTRDAYKGEATRKGIFQPTKSESRKCQNISPPFKEAPKDRVSCVCVVSLYKGACIFLIKVPHDPAVRRLEWSARGARANLLSWVCVRDTRVWRVRARVINRNFKKYRAPGVGVGCTESAHRRDGRTEPDVGPRPRNISTKLVKDEEEAARCVEKGDIRARAFLAAPQPARAAYWSRCADETQLMAPIKDSARNSAAATSTCPRLFIYPERKYKFHLVLLNATKARPDI